MAEMTDKDRWEIHARIDDMLSRRDVRYQHPRTQWEYAAIDRRYASHAWRYPVEGEPL